MISGSNLRGGNSMEDIINKLAEIEAAASHIMDDVSEQKKQLALEYDQAVQDFDRAIDEETQKKDSQYQERAGSPDEGKAFSSGI